MNFRRLFAFTIILAATGNSHAKAAGINCAAAQTPTDKSICSEPEVLALDKKLSEVYDALSTLPADKKSTLRKSQVEWLAQRNRCNTSVNCITNQYQMRLSVLQQQLRTHQTPAPDAVDRAALKQLLEAIKAEMKNDKEFVLEKTLQRFVIKDNTTTFSNVEGPDKSYLNSRSVFPKTRPEGVTEDEWRALTLSNVDAGGEHGAASYELLDVDGDGKRDLIADSYIGGTGLYNYISVLFRRGDRFVGKAYDIDSDESGGELYSLNGRGSNQSALWIRLQNRIYVAYTEGAFGKDVVSLLRPQYPAGERPFISVKYSYRFTIDDVQNIDGKQIKTDPKILAGIRKSLDTLQNLDHILYRGEADQPICPVPPGTPDEEKSEWYAYGPGHYSFEIVTDLPVFIDKQCYLGQIINWFGRYDPKNGLHALLWLRLPRQDQSSEYSLTALRKITGISSGIHATGIDP